MRNEMMKGYVDAIVLSVLQREDAYGYEFSKAIGMTVNQDHAASIIISRSKV